jgi:hypothetical protein
VTSLGEAHETPELLGEISVPSGVLVLVDAGLLGVWGGSRDDLPETVDLRVDGPDADEAGRRFNRSWHPRYWYDIPREKLDDARSQFASFVSSEGLTAELAVVPGAVPHRRRIDLALEHGAGRFGVLEFFGIQSPVVAGLPRGRVLPVHGFRMREDEFSDRWRWVTAEVNKGDTARTEEIGIVFVDEARLMFADADALQSWKHDEPLDGKADYVFWGRDAAAAAARHGAPQLASSEYGWMDLPLEDAAERGFAVEGTRDREGWTFAGDFRPHSHHHEVLRQMRESETGAGVIEVGGARVCAFFTSWGDGAFPVLADLGADEKLLRLRVDLGGDETVRRLRHVLGK